MAEQHSRDIVNVFTRVDRKGASVYTRDEAIAGVVFIVTTLVRSGHTTLESLPAPIRQICLDYFAATRGQGDPGMRLGRSLMRDMNPQMLRELTSVVRNIALDGGEEAAEKLARLSAIARRTPQTGLAAGLRAPSGVTVRKK